MRKLKWGEREKKHNYPARLGLMGIFVSPSVPDCLSVCLQGGATLKQPDSRYKGTWYTALIGVFQLAAYSRSMRQYVTDYMMPGGIWESGIKVHPTLRANVHALGGVWESGVIIHSTQSVYAQALGGIWESGVKMHSTQSAYAHALGELWEPAVKIQPTLRAYVHALQGIWESGMKMLLWY